jgi:hypothetical protein
MSSAEAREVVMADICGAAKQDSERARMLRRIVEYEAAISRQRMMLKRAYRYIAESGDRHLEEQIREELWPPR